MPPPRAATTALPTVSVRDARRLLMDAQGLLADPARPATHAALARLIDKLGFVQLDTITTVERAHHHILASRLDAYRPALLEHLHHNKRVLFEHMTHDASLIPIRFFPHWRPRFERSATNHGWMERIGDDHAKVIGQVLSRIRDHGPCMAREFERDGARPGGAWWDWRPHKAALEYLWRCGELAVASRVSFQKVYDLTSRVHPEAHARPAPTPQEHVDWACSTALERLGVATPGELTAFWRAIKPAQAAAWAADAVKSGAAVQVYLDSGGDEPPKKSLAAHDYRRRLSKALPPPDRTRLLSPFDPILRDRKRALRLFNFDYRFEAFVPAPKRKYGYYVLPILEGDRMVGRLDPKLHRDRGILEIQNLWWEPGVKPGRARRAALDSAIDRFAQFVGADRWVMGLSSAVAK